MAQENEVFVDGIGEIGLVGGVVRIDLVSLSTQQRDAEGKPAMVFRERLVMPPEGFLRTFTAMQNLLTRLEEAGVVKRIAGQEPTVQATPATSPASPNFN